MEVFINPGDRRLYAWPRGSVGNVNRALPVYRWHWRAKLPDRKGQLLVVRARGAMNSCLVEFLHDGFRAITSRQALRRAYPASQSLNIYENKTGNRQTVTVRLSDS